jgi:hypothetical protein
MATASSMAATDMVTPLDSSARCPTALGVGEVAAPAMMVGQTTTASMAEANMVTPRAGVESVSSSRTARLGWRA